MLYLSSRTRSGGFTLVGCRVASLLSQGSQCFWISSDGIKWIDATAQLADVLTKHMSYDFLADTIQSNLYRTIAVETARLAKPRKAEARRARKQEAREAREAPETKELRKQRSYS